MYAGIVVDQYGEVTEHVRDGYSFKIYNSTTGKVEKRIPLDGIKDEKRPGQRIASLALSEGVDYLYTGRRLSVFKLPRWKLILGGIRNRARSGKELNDIIEELEPKYKPQNKLAPTYALR